MNEMIGKYILVGITFLDHNEKVIDRCQTHGRIIAADEQQGVVIEKADATGTFTLPPEKSNIYPAPPGEYRMKETGMVIIDPDYTSAWTVKMDSKESIDSCKKNGFVKP